ncbi:GMC oxidoreductase, partial [Mesorhizobium sp. M1C.F.Ca.ET.192.01.1.1]|uniref:GMC oxidoreductase n=1 Tax=Mesorhizobium sp. M1C.F.Ca.ET.192.01.1.1 TaxID=2496667 RepID=UPI001FE0A626
GNDPATSPLDPFCRAWDHRNLFVVDGGFLPTSAAVNPALSIAAQALRVAVPPAGTYGIGMLKDTAVASTIGVSEVAFNALQEAQRTGHAIQVLTLSGLTYLLLSLPLAYLSRNIDSRLRARFS